MPPTAVVGLDDLVSAVDRTMPRLGRTRLVCVDGPAGSGKTTLAEALRERLHDAALVHMDDVYRGWDTDFDEVHDRLHAQLVEPLREGRDARYQRYDWAAGRFDEWVDVRPPRVLLLEGVGSGSARLDPVVSLLVWIEVDRDERIRRGVDRDGVGVLPQWLAWMEHEEAEHVRQRTRDRADLLLRGDGPDPSQRRWVLSSA